MADRALIGRVGDVRCALPLAHVVETMRPLPVEPIGAVPALVRGLAVIRGAPTVVVDTAALLGIEAAAAPARFVVVRAGERHVALTFDEVIGIRALDASALAALPPLARIAAGDAIGAVAAADAALVVVLAAARAITPEVWARIDEERAT